MRGASLIVALLAGASVLAGQAPQTPSTSATPTFDVVSIKANKSDGNVGGIRPQPGGRFVMVNAPIVRLIRVAYPSPTSQLIGAPPWINSDRYDVDARTEAQPTARQMEAMLRALLAERFKFSAHFESRGQDIYALVFTPCRQASHT